MKLFKINTQKQEENKKGLIMSITIVFFMIFVTVASLVFFKLQTGKMTKVMENAVYEEYEDYYVMIVNDRSSEFWKSVYEGAREDGMEHGAYVELLGNNLSVEYTREQLMEIATKSKVDGIIVEADESGSMTNLINEAVAQGIPVITVLGDNTVGERQSFVGVGSYNLGKEYGRQLIQLCGTETKNVLVLMGSDSDGTSQNILYSGIQETIDKEMQAGGKAILDMKTIESESRFAAEESIRDIFINSEKLPDVMICLDELSTKCVYQAVVDYNKVGKVDVIGFYDSPSILQAIERQVIYSTISIDTKQMGTYCVEALEEYNALGNVSEYFTVDVNVINYDNVTKYIEGGEMDE